MEAILILWFVLGAVLGGGVVWFCVGRKSASTVVLGSNLIGKQAEEKENNKKSILVLLETNAPLTNNHIEQMLGISDATAERYLNELEKEGKVRQVGKTGAGVYYEKT